MTNCMSSGKIMIIPLTLGLIENMSLHKMSQYFPKPYERFNGYTKIELDLSNDARKVDWHWSI